MGRRQRLSRKAAQKRIHLEMRQHVRKGALSPFNEASDRLQHPMIESEDVRCEMALCQSPQTERRHCYNMLQADAVGLFENNASGANLLLLQNRRDAWIDISNSVAVMESWTRTRLTDEEAIWCQNLLDILPLRQNEG